MSAPRGLWQRGGGRGGRGDRSTSPNPRAPVANSQAQQGTRGGRGRARGSPWRKSPTPPPQGDTSGRSRGRGQGRGQRAFQPPRAFSKPSIPADQKWRELNSAGTAEWKMNIESLWQSLKKSREQERAQAIKYGFLADPEKPTSLANAITPVGTCCDMCPEFERVERIHQMMVDGVEKATNDSAEKVPCEDFMVKRFRRSAAGYDEQLPSDIRPPPVLKRTLDYLIDEIIGGPDHLAIVHKFVWDRTRGIRNDFSIQQVTKVEDLRTAIECFERIARFHILSLHQLSHPDRDNGEFDHFQEREQLNNTLLSLMYYYDDSRHKLESPNEAEFRAYCIVFEMQDRRPDLEDRAQNWPQALLQHPRVQTALKLYAAAGNVSDELGPLQPRVTTSIAQGNYMRFWHVLRSSAIPYLLACCAEICFNHIRGIALDIIWKAYRRPSKLDDLALGDVTEALGFDSEHQSQTFCEEHGFTIHEREDGNSFLDLASVPSGNWLSDSNQRRKQLFSKTVVEVKRHGRTLPSVINGLTFDQARAEGLLDAMPESGMSDGGMIDGIASLDGSAGKIAPASGPATTTPNPFLQSPFKPTLHSSRGNPFVKPAANPFVQVATNNPFELTPTNNSSATQTARTPNPFNPFAKPLLSTAEPKSSVPGSKEPDKASALPPNKLSQPTFSSPFINASPTTNHTLTTQNFQAPPSFVTLSQSIPSAKARANWQASPLQIPEPTKTPSIVDRAPSGDDGGKSQSVKPLFDFQKALGTATTDQRLEVDASWEQSNVSASKIVPQLESSQRRASSDGTALDSTPKAAVTDDPESSLFIPVGGNDTVLESPAVSLQISATSHTAKTATASDFTKVGGSRQLNQLAVPSLEFTLASPFPLEQSRSTPRLPALDLPHVSTGLNGSSPPQFPSTPSISFASKAGPFISKANRQEILHKVARAAFLEPHGFFNQFIEVEVSDIVDRAMRKVARELERSRVTEARKHLLSIKYGRRWRDRAWSKALQRKGRERRRTFAQSMQQMATGSQSTSCAFPLDPHFEPFTSLAKAKGSLGMPTPADPVRDERKRHSLPPAAIQRSLLIPDVSLDRAPPEVQNHLPLKRKPIFKHHRSQPAEFLRSTATGRVSKLSQTIRPTTSMLGESRLLNESLMRDASRLVKGRTDTTNTDYFRLKALGVSADASFVPAPRKRRSPEDLKSDMQKAARRASGSVTCRSQLSIPTNGTATKSQPVNDDTRIGGDDDDALFAQIRAVREAMSESESWFKEYREHSELQSRSTSEKPETEAEKRLRECKPTPTRTEQRWRTTGGPGHGLMPLNWDASSGTLSKPPSRESNVKVSLIPPTRTFSSSGIDGSAGPFSGAKGFGASLISGAGASVEDAIEL